MLLNAKKIVMKLVMKRMMKLMKMMIMIKFTDNLFIAICIICEGIWVDNGDIINDDDMSLRKGRFIATCIIIILSLKSSFHR